MKRILGKREKKKGCSVYNAAVSTCTGADITHADITHASTGRKGITAGCRKGREFPKPMRKFIALDDYGLLKCE